MHALSSSYHSFTDKSQLSPRPASSIFFHMCQYLQNCVHNKVDEVHSTPPVKSPMLHKYQYRNHCQASLLFQRVCACSCGLHTYSMSCCSASRRNCRLVQPGSVSLGPWRLHWSLPLRPGASQHSAGNSRTDGFRRAMAISCLR